MTAEELFDKYKEAYFATEMTDGIITKNNFIKAIAEIISFPVEAQVILPKANPTCENCKYWQDVSDDWGYCKFNPPYIKKEQRYKYYYQTGAYDPNLIEDICHKEWVHTDKNDWCGQFEQREP